MTIAVVMPAWNEEEGITEFITELHESLAQWKPTFIVIDDKSTDKTAGVIDDLRSSGLPVSVQTNSVNMGHGPSTLRALRAGLSTHADAVVALDGDGQFIGSDVDAVVAALFATGADVVEGVRRSRNDPLYRQAVSAITRTLVWSRSRRWPTDANTPLRAYRPAILEGLLGDIPASASTPNLLISALCRQIDVIVIEVPVRSIPRRGSDQQGSTWKAKRKSLPSKRFVKFCTQAAREWWSTKPGSNPPSSPLQP